MEAAKILDSSLLDILFENRNKYYGAYQLRKNYNRKLLSALLYTIAITIIFSIIALHHKKMTKAAAMAFPVAITINAVQVPKPKIAAPKPPKSSMAPKLQEVKFTIPKISNDKLVSSDEMPPKQTATNINIGAFNQKGLNRPGLLATPRENQGIGQAGNGSANANGHGGADVTFVTVQVKAQFPGGADAWKKYLERNLRQEVPVDNGAPAGLYGVTVSFLVSANGTISEVRALMGPTPDFGIAAEAIRVIEQGPKWTPAIQNGKYVAFRQTQRIIFQVQDN